MGCCQAQVQDCERVGAQRALDAWALRPRWAAAFVTSWLVLCPDTRGCWHERDRPHIGGNAWEEECEPHALGSGSPASSCAGVSSLAIFGEPGVALSPCGRQAQGSAWLRGLPSYA